MDTLTYRLDQVRKSFSALQKQNQFKRDFTVIKLLHDMSATPDYKQDEKIQKEIRAFLKAKYDPAEEDSEIIKYGGWLYKKLKR
jgi:hypothetical protein